ncbi:hypothetical protein HYS54_02310 [Candidatus Micrarchaeota archaeon]|nr:hypothetical protein [Candidatus Micrarchaeota archaeon]
MEIPLEKQVEIVRNGMFYWMRESFTALRSYPGGIGKWQHMMHAALTAGYEKQGAPRNSGPQGFLEHVVARDLMLGLPAGGEVLSEDKFVYWIQDPFIVLKEKIGEEDYEQISTHGYVKTKLDYFCPGWHATLAKSCWRGNERSEWIIEK